jgi:GntR family transcriptional repressor for pyruvate dehydrogenase complex
LETVLAAGDDRAAYIEADEAFHLAIARIAGNRVLLAFLELLWRLIRPAKSHLLLSPQDRRISDREHQELFQDIVAGDPARARSKMDEHIRQGRALLLDFACTLPAASSETRTERRPANRSSTRKLKTKRRN